MTVARAISLYMPSVTGLGVLYRFEESCGEVRLRTLPITRRTPKGVWVSMQAGESDRFVLDGARKRYAYPTIAEALEGYKQRKRRQQEILHARLHAIPSYIEAAEEIAAENL